MDTQDTYTVHELAQLAGVSTRTLHFYDEKGLLSPERRAQNGYRLYTGDSLLRLQQIRFLKELRFSLEQIRTILNQPTFDFVQALETHECSLKHEAERLQTLLVTVRKTINHLKGEIQMSPQELFQGFSEEKQKEYEEYVVKHYDPELVKESFRRWDSMTGEERNALMAKGRSITTEIVNTIPLGPGSPQTQECISRWHEYINQFYPCSLEILLALGEGYSQHPDFIANYRALHSAMPEFLTEAIEIYCKTRGVEG